MSESAAPPSEEDLLELPDIPLFFGRFLVLKGVLSEQDISEAIRVQRDLSATAICTLIDQGLLSP